MSLNISLESVQQDVLYPQAKSTAELMQEYCSAINTRVIWLLGLIGLMWLFESKLKMLLQKSVDQDKINKQAMTTILFVYKWIGLGLIFMAGYAIMLPNL